MEIIDLLIVFGFLIATLVVGLGHGRDVKTIKDYALGGRNFSTGALVATLLATWVGGGSFSHGLSRTYTDGLAYVIPTYCMVVCMLIMAYVFIPKMGDFLGKVSLAEALGELYGSQVRVIIAVSGIVASVGGIAIQFKVCGNVVGYFAGISEIQGVLVAAFIVTAYSAFGGIKSVTTTDILQLFTFGFALPIVAIMMWDDAYSNDIRVLSSSIDPKFSISSIINPVDVDIASIIALGMYFMLPGFEPEIFQRISMGKNLKQVKKVFVIAGILLIFVLASIQWSSFLLFNVNPSLAKNEIFPYLIDNYTYVGFKGLIVTGVVAMAMSTADSLINTSSILFANDFCKPLNIGINREFNLSKIFAVVLGVGGVFLALSQRDLLDIVLAANAVYMPVVTVPVMLTILGFKTSKKPVLIGMSSGFATVVIWNLMDIEADCIAFAMLINFIALLGSHYILRQPGGWVKSKRINDFDFYSSKNKFFDSKEKGFVGYLKSIAPTDQMSYFGLGIYYIIVSLTTMYSTSSWLLSNNKYLILAFYQIMMVTGIIIAMYPIWPASIKKETRQMIGQILWPITVFYMLIFVSCMFLLASNFKVLQFSVFSINLVVAAILVGWRLSLIMVPAGIISALLFYGYYIGEVEVDFSIGSPGFLIVYILMIVSAVMTIFLKPKQAYQELTEQRNKHLNVRMEAKEKEVQEALALKAEFIRNIQHEYHSPMTGIISTSEGLLYAYDQLDDSERRGYIEDIVNNSWRLKEFDDNIHSLSLLSKPSYDLKRERIVFADLITERISICRRLYEKNNYERVFELDLDKKVSIYADKSYISQLLDNIFINAIKYCQKGFIRIKIASDGVNAILTVADEGIGIPKYELFEIFDPFSVSSKTKTPSGGRGVGLAVCRRIAEVHGGSISADSNGKKGAKFTVELPIYKFEED